MSFVISIELLSEVAIWLARNVLPTGLGAAVPAIASLVKSNLEARSARRLAAEAAFTEALNSDDLTKLSTYLRNEFGKVPLRAYLRDAEVRERLDKYLSRLTEHLAPPLPETQASVSSAVPVEAASEVAKASVTQMSPGTVLSYWEELPTDPPQIVAALSSARAGESWNALARLRRDLEARFRAALIGEVSQRLPMHKIPVPPDAEHVFRRFYRIASYALHGEDVSDDEVIQAIQDARTVYRTMDQIVPDWSRKPLEASPPRRRAVF